MSTIAIDLTKNPELAALVADKQPGDWFELRLSIKALDEQTVTARVEECDDTKKPESDEDEDDEESDDEQTPAPKEEPAERPGKSLARKLSSSY